MRYRDNHILKKSDYPLARVIAGETFSDVTVEVCAPGRDERWMHSIRSQVVTDADGQPDCLVLIITDVTEQYDARFESAFNANPADSTIGRTLKKTSLSPISNSSRSVAAVPAQLLDPEGHLRMPAKCRRLLMTKHTRPCGRI